MKQVKSILLSTFLVCALSSSVFAGDMGSPGVTASGDMGSPGKTSVPVVGSPSATTNDLSEIKSDDWYTEVVLALIQLIY
jgi:hypothetical protein